MQREFLFEAGRHFASCHAATIVDLPDGDLLCAWFAGTHEGHPDVAIWLARYHAGQWSAPCVVADAPDAPLWNPVLYRDAQSTVWLFYKVAPTIPAWTGALIRSTDGGLAWSAPTYLPAGLLGPIKNKPITLSNGDILCPTSSETWMQWACWVEISADGGATWSKHGPIAGSTPETGWAEDSLVSAAWDAERSALWLPQRTHGVIQPTAWEWAPGRVELLMRSTAGIGVVCRASSGDYGRTWGPLRRTAIPNPNSGLDLARLTDGRLVLACNPVAEGRTPLALLVSEDNGDTWPLRIDLETAPGEYSYPSIIQAADGRVHCVYTHRRERIAHVWLSPEELGG
jgi:predicted neuraminidase